MFKLDNFGVILFVSFSYKNCYNVHFMKKNFLQNDSLGVFLCEKSIARIEKPWKRFPDHEIYNFRIFK